MVYWTTLPVVGTEFRDREEALARINRALIRLEQGAPEWLALVGPRRIGKTSLLLEAARVTRHDSILFVTLDAFDYAPVTSELFRLLALRVVDTVFADECGRSLEATIEPHVYQTALSGSPRFGALPAELRSLILGIPEHRLSQKVTRAYLDLPERLASALGRRMMIAIDEFQELAGLKIGKPAGEALPTLRSAWQKHKNVAYIISGSARSFLTDLVSSQSSPFFGHFTLLSIAPFDRKNAIALLVEGAPPNKPISGELAARAYEIFGGNPFYLQLLGEQLVALDAPLDESALKEALSRLVFHRTGRLALYFEAELARIVGRSSIFLAILEEIAKGPRRMSDIQKSLRLTSSTTVNYLARLGDVVERDAGGYYRFADPVMAAWLRWRTPGGAAVPMTIIGDEGEKLVAQRLAELGFDLIYQSRASRGAFDLLAIRNGVMLGVQVKRAELPLRFNAAAWKRMEAEAKRLGWLWIIAAALPDDTVSFLDPKRARREKQTTLRASAAIPNLLTWLDERG